MTKRTQLNINIDESLLDELKQFALSRNLPLSVFIRNSLRDIVSLQKEKTLSRNHSPFSEKQAINCTSFMRLLFKKMLLKRTFKNELEAFNDLLKHIETSKQWHATFTKRLKDVLLSDSASPFNERELNSLTRERECECPIYIGLKEWTGCIEYPSQDLICSLGGSLVLLLENQL